MREPGGIVVSFNGKMCLPRAATQGWLMLVDGCKDAMILLLCAFFFM